jgi:hypothetical protein
VPTDDAPMMKLRLWVETVAPRPAACADTAMDIPSPVEVYIELSSLAICAATPVFFNLP